MWKEIVTISLLLLFAVTQGPLYVWADSSSTGAVEVTVEVEEYCGLHLNPPQLDMLPIVTGQDIQYSLRVDMSAEGILSVLNNFNVTLRMPCTVELFNSGHSVTADVWYYIYQGGGGDPYKLVSKVYPNLPDTSGCYWEYGPILPYALSNSKLRVDMSRVFTYQDPAGIYTGSLTILIVKSP